VFVCAFLCIFVIYRLFVSNRRVIGYEDRLWNDRGLYCVGWGIKLNPIQSNPSHPHGQTDRQTCRRQYHANSWSCFVQQYDRLIFCHPCYTHPSNDFSLIHAAGFWDRKFPPNIIFPGNLQPYTYSFSPPMHAEISVDRYKSLLCIAYTENDVYILRGRDPTTPPVIGPPWLAEYRVIIRRRRIDYSREFIDERVNSSTRCHDRRKIQSTARRRSVHGLSAPAGRTAILPPPKVVRCLMPLVSPFLPLLPPFLVLPPTFAAPHEFCSGWSAPSPYYSHCQSWFDP